MSNLSKIGKLIHLYMDEIELGDGKDAPEFLISSTAKVINETGGRNWIPIIVKEVGEDQYEVISGYIYNIDEIELGDGKDAPEFLISSTAKLLNETSGRNRVVVILKEAGLFQSQINN